MFATPRPLGTRDDAEGTMKARDPAFEEWLAQIEDDDVLPEEFQPTIDAVAAAAPAATVPPDDAPPDDAPPDGPCFT